MRIHFIKKPFALLVGSTLAMLAFSGITRANVKLDSLFSDNMVLQREKPVLVWDSARPGERVAVQIGMQNKTVVADANGAWRVTFDVMPAAVSTPFVATGDDKIELKDVAVGEV